MKKLSYVILIMMLTLILVSGQSYAKKEVQPVFGMYKKVFNENNKFLKQSWVEIHMNKDAAKKFPKLQNALNTYNKEAKEGVAARHKEYCELAENHIDVSSETFSTFYDKTDIIVRRADTVVVSLLEMSSDYLGGVHGMYGWQGINIDTNTGKRLKISDICNDTAKLTEVINQRLNEDYPKHLYDNAKNIILEYIVEDTVNWTIEQDGVSFYFNPYSIAPYASGLLSAKILFSEYPELFKSNYQNISTAYCQAIPANFNNVCSLYDNKRNFLQVYTDIEKGKIIFDGYESETSSMENPQPVLVHLSNGKNYLYIDYGAEKQCIVVYAIKNNGIEFVETMPYTFKHMNANEEIWYFMTNPDNIQFDSMEPVGNITNHFGSVNEKGILSFG